MSVRKFFPVLVPVVFSLGVIGIVLMSGGRDEEDLERAALLHVRKELAGTIIAGESPGTSGRRLPTSWLPGKKLISSIHMQRFQSTMWTMIGKAGAGSKSAVNKLLARYNGPILGFLKQKGLSDEDAEDVAQEVFLQVSAKEFLARADRSKGKFRTLLLRVTRNVLNSEYRKRYSQKRGGEKKRIPMEHLQDVAVSPEDQDQFDRLWAENLIRLGLEKLRADSSRLRVAYHDVLVKRFFEGKSQREIAESMGIKDHDVENYIRNGKERLGRHIAKLGEEYCSSEDEWEEERGLLQRFSP